MRSDVFYIKFLLKKPIRLMGKNQKDYSSGLANANMIMNTVSNFLTNNVKYSSLSLAPMKKKEPNDNTLYFFVTTKEKEPLIKINQKIKNAYSEKRRDSYGILDVSIEGPKGENLDFDPKTLEVFGGVLDEL